MTPRGSQLKAADIAELERQESGTWQAELRRLHLVMGEGALEELGDLVEELGGRRILVVTDPGVRRAGFPDQAADSLSRRGLKSVVFDGAGENPTTEDVERGAAAAREHAIDLLVGLGGGSAMDCAKGINFLYTNGGSMEDYWGFNRATQPMLPAVGVPTTAGTGSEAQSYALISRPDDHVKMACGDEKARFRTVILDPGLLTTAPPEVVSVAGLDALSHAVESYVTKRRNPISQLFAQRAWDLLEANYESVVAGTAAGESWAAMLLGAHFAGTSIELSMLGAAHACANPLTARFQIPHGIAVGLTLPHVVRFNAPAVETLYQELAACPSSGSGAGLAERLEELRALGNLPARLRDLDVDEDALPSLAEEAARQWTAQFNPRPVTARELLELYQAAY